MLKRPTRPPSLKIFFRALGPLIHATTASHALPRPPTTATHLRHHHHADGAASHGAAPSRTSQWYSVDLGLIHFVVLDLDPGPPAVFAGAQAAWAKADLAAADANRANVPWIVVTSHYPLYSASFYDAGSAHASAAWYVGEAAEYERDADGTPWSETPHFEGCATATATGAGAGGGNTTRSCPTVRDIVDESIAALG